MPKTIAQNEYYMIAVDPAKNRIYLTLISYWRSRADVPTYIEDLKKATQYVSKGFTILTDLSLMRAPHPDVVQLHTEAQRIVVSAGLTKTAEVIGPDANTNIAIERFSRDSGMHKRTFDLWREADEWLDEKEPQVGLAPASAKSEGEHTRKEV